MYEVLDVCVGGARMEVTAQFFLGRMNCTVGTNKIINSTINK